MCQQVGGLKTTNLAKLVITLPKESFLKWELNFMGPIKTISRFFGNKYILMAIDYAING
jgi:hypothetical protein